MESIKGRLGIFQQWTLLLVSIGLFLFLASCAGLNRTVSPEQQIPLIRGERQHGTFTQGWESLSYEYVSEGESITLQGEVHSSRSINSIKVRLLFLNQQDTIIGGQFIYHSPYRTHRWRQSGFQQTVTMPKGTENISFDFYVDYRIRR